MKVAIYTRVSTSQQNTDNQKDILIQYCSQQQPAWEYELFEEVESSRNTRPIKAALLHRLRNIEFDAVLVTKICRWARSSSELILEVSELIKKRVGFISYTDKLDFTTSTGRLHFQILSAFAEFERELIRERTIEALRRIGKEKKLGRKKGSKDKKKRSNEGYLLREAKKRVANNTPPK